MGIRGLFYGVGNRHSNMVEHSVGWLVMDGLETR
jgi:hypothetical protein